MTQSNQYFICLQSAPLDPIPWNIPHAQHDPTTVYFGRVLEAMERKLLVDGLTFYLTWNTHKLPSYGNNVVAIVVGDELSKVPSYIHKVRAVFKTFSMRPMLSDNPLLKPSYMSLMSSLQFVRTWLIRTPGLLNSLWHKLLGNRIAPIYDVPAGYYKQADLPIKPIEERRYDLFFAGSVALNYPLWDRRAVVRNPKDIARKAMLAAVEKLQSKYPELKIGIEIASDFGIDPDRTTDKRSYSEKLIDTKICLAPRGSSNETYRFFEGLRYGSITIAEALPSRWFYDGSPAIQLKDWSELEKVVAKLLIENRQFLQQKHEESLKWWADKCSEIAVGTYIAETLNLN